MRISYGLVWNVPVPRLRKSWRAALFFIALTTLGLGLSALVSALTNRFLVGAVLASIMFICVPFAVWLYISWLLPHPPHIDVVGAGTGRDRVRGGRRDPAHRHGDLDPVSRLYGERSTTGAIGLAPRVALLGVFAGPHHDVVGRVERRSAGPPGPRRLPGAPPAPRRSKISSPGPAVSSGSGGRAGPRPTRPAPAGDRHVRAEGVSVGSARVHA